MVAAMPWPAAKASSIRVGNIVRALLAEDPDLEVSLFAYEGRAVAPHPRLALHRVGGFDADEARYDGWRNELAADVRLLRALLRERRRIDRVWAHTDEGLAIALAFRALTRGRPPICADLHGPFVPELVHSRMIPDWRPLRAGLGLLETAMLSATAQVFASNEALAQMVAERIGAGPVHVLFDDVDLALFDPTRVVPERLAVLEARYRPAGERLVVSVGMFKDYRGVDLFVRAFARIAPARPDRRLLLVGDGPCRAQYEAIAREAGIADRVILPGRVPHADIVHWLRLADLLVSPRVDNAITRGGFVSQMPESVAAGRPIVATPVSGCAYLLRDGAAILVAPNDVATLARGLEQALGLSAEERAAMTARARRCRELHLAARDRAGRRPAACSRDRRRVDRRPDRGRCRGWRGARSMNANRAGAAGQGDRRVRILWVFGTRPEAIKMAPLVLRLARHPGFDARVCVTAQHRRMLDSVLADFAIRPDFDLDVMREGQSLSGIAARVLDGLEPVLRSFRPDRVLVHGDTTTTLAASLAAFYDQVPVGRVEAGLRTGDRSAPWPEEANRKVAAVVTDLDFAPTERADARSSRKARPPSGSGSPATR